MLIERCSVCNLADDGFIGIQFRDGKPRVTFPRGYRLSSDEDSVRKDILNLIAVLQRFSHRQEGDDRDSEGAEETSFPILSYQYIIYD